MDKDAQRNSNQIVLLQDWQREAIEQIAALQKQVAVLTRRLTAAEKAPA